MTAAGRRTRRVQRVLAVRRVDGFLVTNAVNVRYLAGVSDVGWALIGRRDAVLMPYGLSYDAIRAWARPPWRVLGPAQGWPPLRALLARQGIRRMGFESEHLPAGAAGRLRKAVAAEAIALPLAGIVERLRMVKDREEIAALRRAGAIAAEVAAQVPWLLREGMTEAQAAEEVDVRIRRAGADGPAFETIVLFGERTALPHGHPGPRRLEPGDLVLADFGARLDGYHSDMTRVWAWRAATARQRAAYAAVATAYARARAAVRAGVTCAEPDRVARRALGRFERRFVHTLGHGVGLQIHEEPRLWKEERGRLAAGMAVTVEPGIYVPGWGGVRLEDSVVVRRGPAESLTGAPAGRLTVAGAA